ncbi:aminoacylase [Aureococcus anophagefferens]|nr:aminoacylase [Aureococcus anophagefferens]
MAGLGERGALSGLAHLDVVPPGSADGWDRPPFRGDVAADASGEECVWGRGAIDDKNMVLARPRPSRTCSRRVARRDVYLLFGHDEEVGGLDGAKRVAAHLRDVSGVARFDFLLDEGLFVTEGVVPSHAKPVAMICVAEKGFANVKLTCRSPPGHASVPGPDGALGRLARAVTRLERRPMPSRPSVALAMFATLRGGFSWPLELVVSNLWLFGPVLAAVLASKPETASLVRTTTAVTIFRSGQKKNVLPDEAVAYVNHRLHPDDSLDDVLAHDRRVIADPYDADHPWGVEVEVEDFTPPSKVSTADHAAFRHLRAATLEVFGDTLIMMLNERRWELAALVSGGVMGGVAFGVSASFGLFLKPITDAENLKRQVIGLAVGLNMLVQGFSSIGWGALTDTYGAAPVMACGAALEVASLVATSYSEDGWQFYLAVPVEGLATGALSFSVVLGAVGKLVAPERRSRSLGMASSTIAIGNVVVPPITYALLASRSWSAAMRLVAGGCVVMFPLCLCFAAAARTLRRGRADYAAAAKAGDEVANPLRPARR